jgi:hypothetical protein
LSDLYGEGLKRNSGEKGATVSKEESDGRGVGGVGERWDRGGTGMGNILPVVSTDLRERERERE